MSDAKRSGREITADGLLAEIGRRDDQIIGLWHARRRLAWHVPGSFHGQQWRAWRDRYSRVGLVLAPPHPTGRSLPGLVTDYDVAVALRRRPSDAELRRLAAAGCVNLEHPDNLLADHGWVATMGVLSAAVPGDACDAGQARVAAAGDGLASEVRDIEALRRARRPAISAGAGE